MVRNAVPTTGKILYFPVADMTLPARVDTSTTGTIIGSISSPELVADAPCTVCWNSGRYRPPPNMTTPATRIMAIASG